MNRKKVASIILAIAAVVLLVGLAFAVRLPAKADMVAVLRTSGMTCSSCSQKIQQALQGGAGIAQVEVDLQNGLVFVGYDSNKSRPDIFAEKVSGSGYRSTLLDQVTLAEFRTITGRDFGTAASGGGCGNCGSGGCGMPQQNGKGSPAGAKI